MGSKPPVSTGHRLLARGREEGRDIESKGSGEGGREGVAGTTRTFFMYVCVINFCVKIFGARLDC